jgi:hypothetical protein
MHRGLIAMKWQPIITKKIQDKRIVICHKSTSDGSALTIMCGRDEQPWPNAATCWRITMVCTCCRAMDTRYW